MATSLNKYCIEITRMPESYIVIYDTVDSEYPEKGMFGCDSGNSQM